MTEATTLGEVRALIAVELDVSEWQVKEEHNATVAELLLAALEEKPTKKLMKENVAEDHETSESSLKDVDLVTKETTPKTVTCHVRGSAALESVEPAKIRAAVAKCFRRKTNLADFRFESLTDEKSRYCITFDVGGENHFYEYHVREAEMRLLKDVAAKLSALVEDDDSVHVDVGYILTVWQTNVGPNDSAGGILAAFTERKHASDYVRKVCHACLRAFSKQNSNTAPHDNEEEEEEEDRQFTDDPKVREVLDYARALFLILDDDVRTRRSSQHTPKEAIQVNVRFDQEKKAMTFDLDALNSGQSMYSSNSYYHERSLAFVIEPFLIWRGVLPAVSSTSSGESSAIRVGTATVPLSSTWRRPRPRRTRTCVVGR